MSLATSNMDLLQRAAYEALPLGIREVLEGKRPWWVEKVDAVEGLRRLPLGCLSLIATDPAYASLEKHRAKGTTTRLKVSEGSSNEWFDIFPDSRYGDLFSAAYGSLRPDSHFYMMADEQTADVVKQDQGVVPADYTSSGARRCRSGFVYWRSLLWVKTTRDGRPYGGMGYHYRGACERVMFFEKGKRKLNDLGLTDVLMFPKVTASHWGDGSDPYPTEKPRELAEVLIRQSTDNAPEGASAGFVDIVCDPFCGSGSVGAAAVANGRRFIGFDTSDRAIRSSSLWLTNLVGPGPVILDHSAP